MDKIPKGNITTNIADAPYKIDDRVKVVLAADETTDLEFLGHTGKVVHLNYSNACGQSFPDDPMIGVEFEGSEVESFWKEELEKQI